MDRIGHLVRAVDVDDGRIVVGVVQATGIAPLRGVETLAELLRLDTDDFDSAVVAATDPIPFGRLRLLPPIDGVTEVWAAGVTYLASKEARVEESGHEDVYLRVYEAERPELFFKAPAWRVVTDGEPIAVRDDSENDVPEPEVGLVLNSGGNLVAFTIVDDVSSRSIEGANPLYLPQAKMYDGCCAVGPSIVPRRLVDAESGMAIRMTIHREGRRVFEGASSTSRLKRTFEELARFLFLQASFPDGAILATGTSVVPDVSTTLLPGDVVEISIDGLGTMTTPVARAAEVGPWLTERRTRPATAPVQASGVAG